MAPQVLYCTKITEKNLQFYKNTIPNGCEILDEIFNQLKPKYDVWKTRKNNFH